MNRLALASILVFATLAPAMARADDRSDSTRHAWSTFFGQTGGIASVAIASSVFMAVEEEDNAIGILWLVPLMTGGGTALGLVAEENDWDPHLGWALSGIYPGALAGVALGLGTVSLEGAFEQRGALLEATLTSGAVGALLGALGLWAESLDGGHPGALTGGFYAGFSTGLAAGMIAMSLSDSPEALAAPLIASAVGGLLGVVVTEAIRQTTD